MDHLQMIDKCGVENDEWQTVIDYRQLNIVPQLFRLFLFHQLGSYYLTKYSLSKY